MQSKAQRTTQYIIETVAPIFNKKGYAGTSMADLTDATGLTKGAIYGNFENKEDLALQSFNYNLRKVMKGVQQGMEGAGNALGKLFAICDWYSQYYDLTKNTGGCPVLNVAIDSNHIDPALNQRAKEVIHKLKRSLADIIRDGISEGNIKQGVDPDAMGSRIYGMIQGSIFMTMTLNDPSYIKDMMNHIKHMIHDELAN